MRIRHDAPLIKSQEPGIVRPVLKSSLEELDGDTPRRAKLGAMSLPGRGEAVLILDEAVQGSRRVTLELNPDNSRPRNILCLAKYPYIAIAVKTDRELSIKEEAEILRAIAPKEERYELPEDLSSVSQETTPKINKTNLVKLVNAFSSELLAPGVLDRIRRQAGLIGIGPATASDVDRLFLAKRAAINAIVTELSSRCPKPNELTATKNGAPHRTTKPG